MSVLSRLAKYIFPLVLTGLAIAAVVLLAMMFQKSHTHPTSPPPTMAAVRLPVVQSGGCGYKKKHSKPQKGRMMQRGQQRRLMVQRPMQQRRQMQQHRPMQPAPYVASGSAGAAPL